MNDVEIKYSEEQLHCSVCGSLFKKGEYIKKCLECGEYFHSYLCHREHSVNKHAPYYNEYEFGCEEIPTELHPKWNIITFDIDDLLWRGRHYFLNPKKIRKYAEAIIRRLDKMIGWVDLGFDDLFKEAFLEEYPDFEKDSELCQKTLKIMDIALTWWYKDRIPTWTIVRGECICCSDSTRPRKKKLFWRNNSTGLGFCKKCYLAKDKDDLLNMEASQ